VAYQIGDRVRLVVDLSRDDRAPGQHSAGTVTCIDNDNMDGFKAADLCVTWDGYTKGHDGHHGVHSHVRARTNSQWWVSSEDVVKLVRC